MKERPILFSGPMVRALLAGTKTQTRRIVKDQDPFDDFETLPPLSATFGPCPCGEAGDRLWVKETFRLRADQDDKPPREDWWKSGAWYDAAEPRPFPSGCGGGPGKLRPSIFMPRWASRITLEISDVRVERLQAITEEDAKAEGVEARRTDEDCWSDGTYRSAYEYLWGEINGWDGQPGAKAPWPSNPWVWALTFKRLDCGGDR